MSNEEKAILLQQMYQEEGNKTKGFIEGMTHAGAYYLKHKSGRRQAGYTIGNLLANVEILTRHTISKIKK
jgi:hypothetical protein